MNPVLVTGARGFAGRYLVELLTSAGDAVTGWGREDVDLLDRAAVERGIAELRPSVIYHCAGVSHVGHSFANARETLAANVMGTHHLLDALRRARLTSKVLIPSSSLVYRHSDAPLTEDAPLHAGHSLRRQQARRRSCSAGEARERTGSSSSSRVRSTTPVRASIIRLPRRGLRDRLR